MSDMDMLWIPDGRWDYFDAEAKMEIQDFSRNGGKIVMWNSGVSDWVLGMVNDFLTDSGWQTTVELFDMEPHQLEYMDCIYTFTPFTDGVDSLKLDAAARISCGSHAYPFVFRDSCCSVAAAAISYPFLHEDNCSSYIVLQTGAYGYISTYCGDSIHLANNVRFAVNILLAAAGVPGYELEPGAIPGGGNACDTLIEYHCLRTPNPFTPNSDGINDYAQFEFDGMGEIEGTIYIFDLYGHEVRSIKVPSGGGAKQAARWDGKDNDGNPLKQGLYMYVIESGGEIVCEGTTVLAR